MKCSFRLITYLLAFAFLASCGKSTSVSGTLTNQLNGKPLSGHEVKLRVFDGYEHDSSVRKLAGTSTTRTAADGSFFVEYAGGSGIDYAELHPGEYCSNFFKVSGTSIKAKRSNTADVQIIPVNGSIALVVENTQNVPVKFYSHPNASGDYHPQDQCINMNLNAEIPANSIDTLIRGVSADRFVQIHWGLSPFSNWNSTFVDSAFCPIGERTPIRLTF